ncbi:Holliday junction DNA helicase RuvA [Catonella morbi ATCC 51271]|uniref:Holliday junction branch migration complex subunit RuvA n=1 Tax=Catonella morbi ATCC 51271 TaxID=592026 RepID=V2Y9P9_9FIRM|nr:Holliday junction branch migration protein RuvA [Catonella morbi]ESL04401.1 Holliday junction DNA helicase RuvA [Catonella morbi ATCC 51271]
MIASVKGKLEGVTTESVIIDVNGLGVEAIVPTTVINLLPKIDENIKLHTYLHVREDVMQLYGFLEKEDLDFFKLLITVNGIGPKAAIAILSSMPTDILTFAILSEDTKTIQKAQGIGAKTAKKLVLELKDKVGIIKTPQNTGSEIYDNAALTIGINSEIKDEAVQVLTALGYSQTEAVKAISTVEMYEEMTSEELVKLSLKNLM